MTDKTMLEEIEEANQLLAGDRGEPVMSFEPPSTEIVRNKDGSYEERETPPWIKFGTGFRSELKKLKGPALAVYMSICLHVNKDGWAFPGIRLIAEETGYDKETVLDALEKIDSVTGLMEVLKRKGPHGTNKYRPAFASYGKFTEPKSCTEISDTKSSVRIHDSQRTDSGVSASGNHAQSTDKRRDKKREEDSSFAPPTVDGREERIIKSVTQSTVENDMVIECLRAITGKRYTEDAFIKTGSKLRQKDVVIFLRSKSPTRDNFRHFAHWWQLNKRWQENKGGISKPSYFDVYENWEAAMEWSPNQTKPREDDATFASEYVPGTLSPRI